ncbi:hypothetical protein MRX96_057308 [Rhipicephalus microplus]
MGKKRLSVPDTFFYDIDSEEETTEKKHWPAVPVAAANALQAHLLITAPMNMRPPQGHSREGKAVAVHAAIAARIATVTTSTVATTTMAVLAIVSTRMVSNAAFATAAALTATRASVAFFRAATDAAMPIDATGTTPWNYFKWLSRTYQPGNGIFLEQEKWAWLLLRPRDSLFCKEATKLLWGVSAFHNGCITGAPCRRYVRSEYQAPPRRAHTPKKLEAVGNAFSKYIAGRQIEVAAIERLRKMNRFLAEMLNDLNK